ncbi:MAG: hypothetical protein KGZ39_02770 [Simkania sp.]|nr:hypothetical protein [Simkania sp.]
MSKKIIALVSTVIFTSLPSIEFADTTTGNSATSGASSAPGEVEQNPTTTPEQNPPRAKTRPSSIKPLPAPFNQEPSETLDSLSSDSLQQKSGSGDYSATYAKRSSPRQRVGDPFWSADLELLFVKRKGVKQKFLAVDTSVSGDIDPLCMCPQGRVITSNQLMNLFVWEPGVRATLGYSPNARQSVIAAVSWINEWESKKTATADQTLKHDFGDPDYALDYSEASKATGRYTSHLWDAEVNYWRHYTPRDADYFSVSGIIGLRGFYLGEHLRLEFHKPPDRSSFWTMSKNRLYGAQVGGNLQVNPWRHWSWEWTAKAGVFANWATDINWLGDQNNTVVLRSHHSSAVGCSYLIDTDLLLVYRFRAYCRAMFGFGLMGLWGVATAPGQLISQHIPQAGDEVGIGGKVYFQKLSLGISLDF